MIDDEEWLTAFRSAAGRISRSVRAARLAGTLGDLEGTRGAGGDATLAIDAVAEEHIFDELRRLGRGGDRFTAISEERGTVEFGDSQGATVVAIDPIDGSLNAKRMLVHHAVSIAVAQGPTIDDVTLGYVFDLGAQEEYVGIVGQGAWLDGKPIFSRRAERRSPDGRLELLAVETNDTRALAGPLALAGDVATKVRVLGSVASAVCQLAVGRVDAMINVTRCRAVDVAAATIIARESGVIVGFPHDPAPRLDLVHRSAFAAARTDESLSRLMGLLLDQGY